jgi:hypothetical protein
MEHGGRRRDGGIRPKWSVTSHCSRCSRFRLPYYVHSLAAMEFAPKPGCPLCGIVASAAHTTHNSPRSPSFPTGSTQPEVIWRDDNFTVYREKANPVSSAGHLVFVFKWVSLSVYPWAVHRRGYAVG